MYVHTVCFGFKHKCRVLIPLAVYKRSLQIHGLHWKGGACPKYLHNFIADRMAWAKLYMIWLASKMYNKWASGVWKAKYGQYASYLKNQLTCISDH